MSSCFRRGFLGWPATAKVRSWAGALTAAWSLALLLDVPSLGTAQPPAPAAAPDVRLLLRKERLPERPGRDYRHDPTLRANCDQEIFAYVINDSDEEQTVTVQLLVKGAPVASQKVTVKAFDWKLVPWSPSAAGTSDKGGPLAELKGAVSLRLADKNERPFKEEVRKPELKGIALRLAKPSSYLNAEPRWFPARGERKNALAVRITARNEQLDPPCPVELVLDQERIPALVPGQKEQGSSSGLLRRVGDTVPPLLLFRRDLLFEGSVREGLVFIRADGYDRAFAFQTTFSRSVTPGTPQPSSDSRVWISVEKTWDSRQKLHVGLQADNLPEPKTDRLVRLVLELSQAEVSDWFKDVDPSNVQGTFVGEKNVHFFGGVGGPTGGLLIRTEVKDWFTDLDLRGVRGKIILRLRAVDEKNKTLTGKMEGKDVLLRDEKTVLLDDTPPEKVRLVVAAKSGRAVRGSPVLLEARGEDPESQIGNVVFFAGPPMPDGSVPAKAVFKTAKTPEKDKPWAGDLVVPVDQKGPFIAAVRFVNGVGLSTTVEKEIEVEDPPGVWTGPAPVLKKASIAGSVTEGGRPQSGITVTLQNADNKDVGSVTTTAQGTYTFQNLEPGTYKVTATKSASQTKGTETVTLRQGMDKTDVAINLYR
jgi:hypothetical protein